MADRATASFILRDEEVVEAAKFTAMKRLFSRPLLPVFIVLLVIFAILAIISDKREWMIIALAMALAAPLAFAATILWIVPWHAKKHRRQAVALQDEMSADWDDEGIAMQSARGNSRLAWTDYHGWAETASLIVLYQSEMFYNIIPKRALSLDEIEAIKRRLRAAGVAEL